METRLTPPAARRCIRSAVTVSGLALDGELDGVVKDVAAVQGVEQAGPQVRAEVGRRAPSGEDGAGPKRHAVGGGVELTDEGIGERGLAVGPRRVHDRVEVAVVALVEAERQVEVERVDAGLGS